MGREPQDPVAERDDGSQDLYEIADWEVRSVLDWLVYSVYYVATAAFRAAVVLLAVFILLAQFAIPGYWAVIDPVVGVFTLLSVVPALALVAYVWHVDITTKEPLELLVGTFLLGVLFAGFAGVVNAVFGYLLGGNPMASVFLSLVFFYLVVGPGEEAVKLLAVRLFAYRSDRFDAVIDGAVYGAVAGLGFATIENALYISGVAFPGSEGPGTGTLVVSRTLVGPGHVVFSAFAGYYLGLAKFNREHAGPIVLKGLVIASLMHATYNFLLGIIPGIVTQVYGFEGSLSFASVDVGYAALANFVFIVVYVGFFTLLLLRRLRKYGRAYRRSLE